MKALGLSQWIAKPESKQALLDLLALVNWKGEANINEKIATTLRSVQVDEPSEGMLMPHAGLIEQLCSGGFRFDCSRNQQC